MDKVRLAFSDQLWNFDPHNNLWLTLWRKFAEVELVQELHQADVLIYSDWGRKHWDFKGLKIYHSGENMLPDFGQCDLAFTSMELPDEPRNIRLPIYFFYLAEAEKLIKSADFDARAVLAAKTKFCNFLVSNGRSPMRNQAFKQLNRRQRVDSGGKHFNNLGYRVEDKFEFVRQYKFTLAFENSSTPGYTTEKLLEPMLAGSLPIYWGNPDVARDFNPESFIVAERFASIEALVDHVLAVDADDELYLRYTSQPWLPGNQLTPYFSHERIGAALQQFWNQRPQPGIRHYSVRRLRQHVHASRLAMSWQSFKCRLESAAWNLTRQGRR